MKAGMGLMVAVVAVASNAGCASMQRESGYVPQVTPVTVVQDAEYVARVEQLAKRRGVGVVWVNPPKKRLPLVASSP